MRTLVVAAGGGGDAITGSTVPAILGDPATPFVLTYSWDRLLVDPLPGPRCAADFEGLTEIAPGLFEVLPDTRPIGGAGSSLPRLAAELPARIALLDPSAGSVGMARQITAAVELTGATEVLVVDVGGDVLTDGHDPGLRSPLADQLALAATVATGLPARLIVAAPGIDGELPADVVLHRLHALDATQLVTPDLDAIRQVFTWHPSEASGLLAAAAAGLRGIVEVRDAGDQIHLTDSTPTFYAVDAPRAAKDTPAVRLAATRTLDQTEQTIREVTGISEIAYETAKASRRSAATPHRVTSDDLARVDHHAYEARDRGADFLSVRRLSELLGATSLDTYTSLTELLTARRSDLYEPPVLRTARHE